MKGELRSIMGLPSKTIVEKKSTKNYSVIEHFFLYGNSLFKFIRMGVRYPMAKFSGCPGTHDTDSNKVPGFYLMLCGVYYRHRGLQLKYVRKLFVLFLFFALSTF